MNNFFEASKYNRVTFLFFSSTNDDKFDTHVRSFLKDNTGKEPEYVHMATLFWGSKFMEDLLVELSTEGQCYSFNDTEIQDIFASADGSCTIDFSIQVGDVSLIINELQPLSVAEMRAAFRKGSSGRTCTSVPCGLLSIDRSTCLTVDKFHSELVTLIESGRIHTVSWEDVDADNQAGLYSAHHRY